MNRYKKITFYNSKFKIQNSKFKIQNWLRRNAFQNWLTPKCVSKLADAELRCKIGCAEPFYSSPLTLHFLNTDGTDFTDYPSGTFRLHGGRFAATDGTETCGHIFMRGISGLNFLTS
jgi:hypothetical protein